MNVFVCVITVYMCVYTVCVQYTVCVYSGYYITSQMGTDEEFVEAVLSFFLAASAANTVCDRLQSHIL